MLATPTTTINTKFFLFPIRSLFVPSTSFQKKHFFLKQRKATIIKEMEDRDHRPLFRVRPNHLTKTEQLVAISAI
jgi:hypothetical protein